MILFVLIYFAINRECGVVKGYLSEHNGIGENTKLVNKSGDAAAVQINLTNNSFMEFNKENVQNPDIESNKISEIHDMYKLTNNSTNFNMTDNNKELNMITDSTTLDKDIIADDFSLEEITNESAYSIVASRGTFLKGDECLPGYSRADDGLCVKEE